MPYRVIDKRATAIANGYSAGQADACERMAWRDFFILFTDQVIRGDGLPIVWKFKDVSQEPPCHVVEGPDPKALICQKCDVPPECKSTMGVST